MPRKRKTSQLELPIRGRGGRRPGAGRPKSSRRVTHVRRPDHKKRFPVIVTMRAKLRSLRRADVYERIVRAIYAATRKDEDPNVVRMRIVHYAVQDNHLHFIIEAVDRTGITLGSQGLAIRIARAVNRVLHRKGKVFDDRYHARELRTPREVRRTLVYVLQNRKKHGALETPVDPCSSAAWFTGWADRERASDTLRRMWDDWFAMAESLRANHVLPVGLSNTYLLAVGWRRHGLISVTEAPKAA